MFVKVTSFKTKVPPFLTSIVLLVVLVKIIFFNVTVYPSAMIKIPSLAEPSIVLALPSIVMFLLIVMAFSVPFFL